MSHKYTLDLAGVLWGWVEIILYKISQKQCHIDYLLEGVAVQLGGRPLRHFMAHYFLKSARLPSLSQITIRQAWLYLLKQ